ncbi:hypothetical protein [Stenotrophomonas sp. B1-1]|uniref:hypothetical protein n=1 Tax=Stenotrophomonas sp. B1-1 TaxID=2710648 RepID=UPI0013DCEBBC|nr:hypothetical protein [Stenotrophomonas sp. B1-1]
MMLEVQRQLVGRLTQIMVEAAPDVPRGATSAQGEPAGPWLDQGERARMMREILRISMRYGWCSVVEEALDRARAPALRHLETAQLAALSDELKSLIDCAMTACDLTDDLPAR